MAVLAFTDAYVSINAVALSDHVKSVELNVEVEDLDSTAMGATYTAHIGGLKSGTMTITFNQDFAASNVDATIWGALGTVVAFEVRPTSSAASATNPKYTGSVLISQAAPLGNSVGELAAVQVTWPTTGVVTRATT